MTLRDDKKLYLWLRVFPSQRGLTRKFFSGNTCRGFKLLQSQGLRTKCTIIKSTEVSGIMCSLWNEKATEGLYDKHADHWLASKRATKKIQRTFEKTEESEKHSLAQQVKREFIM